jgi:hypothetical protein
MSDPYAGQGRGGDPHDRWSRWDGSEPDVRRFEIRRIGGRTVIIPID